VVSGTACPGSRRGLPPGVTVFANARTHKSTSYPCTAPRVQKHAPPRSGANNTYRRTLCKIAKDRELGNETKITGQYACKIKIVPLKLKFIEMKQKIENKRDYDKERKELFDNAMKEVDPRIQKTIELIEKINNSNVQIKYELSTSCYSTTI